MNSHILLYSDDKVENVQLAAAFDITCNAWKVTSHLMSVVTLLNYYALLEERFNVKYTYCGCPLPGDTIGERLSRYISFTHTPQPPSQLIPPDRPDLLAATHASDHNAVYFKPKNKRAHKITQKRQKALAKAAKKGRGLLGHRATVPSHPGAFLIPVPLHFGGYGGVGLGRCVATGAIVSCGGGFTDVCYMLFRGYATNLHTSIRETVLVPVPLGVEGAGEVAVEEVGGWAEVQEVGGWAEVQEMGGQTEVQEMEDTLAEIWVGDAVEVCVSNITS